MFNAEYFIKKINEIEQSIYSTSDVSSQNLIYEMISDFVQYIQENDALNAEENITVFNQVLNVLEMKMSSSDMVGINDILVYELTPILNQVKEYEESR